MLSLTYPDDSRNAAQREVKIQHYHNLTAIMVAGERASGAVSFGRRSGLVRHMRLSVQGED